MLSLFYWVNDTSQVYRSKTLTFFTVFVCTVFSFVLFLDLHRFCQIRKQGEDRQRSIIRNRQHIHSISIQHLRLDILYSKVCEQQIYTVHDMNSVYFRQAILIDQYLIEPLLHVSSTLLYETRGEAGEAGRTSSLIE